MGTFFWHAPNNSLIVVVAASSADRKRETSAASLSNFGLKEPLLPFSEAFPCRNMTPLLFLLSHFLRVSISLLFRQPGDSPQRDENQADP